MRRSIEGTEPHQDESRSYNHQSGGQRSNRELSASPAQKPNFTFEKTMSIGHGRGMRLCSLAPSFLKFIEDHHHESHRPWELYKEMDVSRPSRDMSWALGIITLVCFLFVIGEVMLAFSVDLLTPTVGLGCWSGCALLYGILITINAIFTFLFQSLSHRWRKFLSRRWKESLSQQWRKGGLSLVWWICLTGNALALVWLITITGFIVSVRTRYLTQDKRDP